MKALTGLTGYRDVCKSEQENAKLLQIDAVLGVQIVCDTGKWVKLWKVEVWKLKFLEKYKVEILTSDFWTESCNSHPANSIWFY